MNGKKNQVESNAGRTTIVGGRPLGGSRGRKNVPRGIEVLIKKASVDPAFRQLLLEKRAAAAVQISLPLASAEVNLLNHIPRVQLETIIENTTVPDPQRRAFLGSAGCGMLALLGGIGAVAITTTLGHTVHLPDLRFDDILEELDDILDDLLSQEGGSVYG